MSGGKGLFLGSVVLLPALLSAVALPPRAAFALSELKQLPGETPETDEAPAADDDDAEALRLPMPDPLIRKDETVAAPAQEDDDGEPEATVEVLYDIGKAPEPVRRMRELIVEAAASGEIERLGPLLGKGVTETQVSAVETEESPVDTLKGLSGDPDGMEILAILLDVLAAGYAHVGAGTPEEIYVWPYFAAKPLAELTAPEKVELLRIVTAGDVADMVEFGSYNFYRLGITPDGQWKFFVAGD